MRNETKVRNGIISQLINDQQGLCEIILKEPLHIIHLQFHITFLVATEQVYIFFTRVEMFGSINICQSSMTLTSTVNEKLAKVTEIKAGYS